MLTIKKKRPEAEVTGVEAAAAAPVVASTPAGLEPAAAPAPVSGSASARSYGVFAVLGIVMTLCVMAVLALQYKEYADYQAEPSVWLAK